MHFNCVRIHSIQQFMSKLKEFRSIHSDQMMITYPWGSEVGPGQQIIM